MTTRAIPATRSRTHIVRKRSLHVFARSSSTKARARALPRSVPSSQRFRTQADSNVSLTKRTLQKRKLRRKDAVQRPPLRKNRQRPKPQKKRHPKSHRHAARRKPPPRMQKLRPLRQKNRSPTPRHLNASQTIPL